MPISKETGRRIFQLCALALVLIGIYHSVHKSTDQLRARQAQLTEQARELRERAESATDPALRSELQQRSEQLLSDADSYWQASPVGLLCAGGCYALGMLPASLYWRRCLTALDQPSGGLLDVLWAYFYGNLGKYFPGKAMVIVLRLAALDRYGIQKTATSITIFMETLTMMSVGGAIASVSMIVLNLDWKLTLLATGLLLATFVPTSPPVVRLILPRLQRGVAAETLETWTNRITWRLFARGWCMLTLTWLAFGSSLWFVLRSLSISDFSNSSSIALAISVLGSSALAVVLGFVSLIPGGAGVREVVLSAVLSPVVGPVAALCGALWLRIVWLATEVAVVALLGLARALRSQELGPVTTPDAAP